MSDDSFSMMELFRQEVETQGMALSQGLIDLEGDPTRAATLQSLMRAAHSIKGAARIVGVGVAAEVSHDLEDCFIAAQEGRIQLGVEAIDCFLIAADLLSEISRLSEDQLETWSATNAERVTPLRESLRAIAKGQAVSATILPVPDGEAAGEPEKAAAPGGDAAAPVADSAPAEEAPAVKEASVDKAEGREAAPAADESSAQASTVRVAAASLNRLMGLTAEGLVEARRLAGFREELLRIKNAQLELGAGLEHLEATLNPATADLELAARLGEARQMAQQIASSVRAVLEEFDAYSRRNTLLSDRLYREVLASRMRPFSDGVAGFPRLVRDLSRSLKKKIRFELDGGRTPVDRDILDKLEAPLTHIVRNACDHGIESPEDRKAAGKPEGGVISIRARHSAGMLVLEVSDDGRGINVDALRRKVLEKGLVTEQMATSLSEEEVLNFLFLPGFSTAATVTDISGRGVGLDVVLTTMQEVGGVVRIHTEVGSGTTFHLQLPITRSVIRALLVDVGGEPYAFPLTRLHRTLKLQASEIETLEGRSYVSVDGHSIGLVSIAEALQVDGGERPSEDEIAVVVVGERGSLYGLQVNRLVGEVDLVVRPLDPRLGKVPGISAAAIDEHGFPVLIVDAEDLIRLIDKLLSGGGLRRIQTTAASTDAPRRSVLVVDDSITVRETERQLLENAGYRVETAVDGADGWNTVRLGNFDLVVTDVDMPRMNGFELVSKIKSDPRLSGMPVIIVSYKDREEDKRKGLEVGADYYLTKSSFQDESFISAVVALIGEAGE